MIIIELNKHKQENNFKEFYKKISTFIPSLKKLASSKLKLAENEALIDKGFYNTNDILDEVFLDVFKTFSSNMNEKQLKQTLLLKTIQKINEKTEEEEKFPNDISIDAILKEELDLLNEDYSVEADGDYIFDEDLDDISYKQNSFKSAHFILDQPLEMELTGKLNLSNASLSSDKSRTLFGSSFYTLPTISKRIIELFVFGDQTTAEIADTLFVEEEKVQKVIVRVKERLEKL
ncbi:hypothetical protein [uncultured Lutibacter sp.]|uniref:hypothetical protein n=1 Tax=uncultured Lutibacter sp. TaxID=437739 RepID=UPI002607190A|nr:hypothetical protein [uncultured Lutibacter sp.]